MSLERPADPGSRSPVREAPPALILGDDPVNGLGVARNLGRSGVRVHRLGAQAEPLLRSRYIRTQRVVPNLDSMDDSAYLRELVETGERIGGQAVLFPLTDLHVMRICRLEERLRGRFRLTTPSLQSAMTLVNKRQFYEAAAALGVDHPATRFPETLEEFERAAQSLGYPVYLKPEISPLYHGKFGRKGFVAHDAASLLAGAAELLGSGLRAILQEIIPGDASQMHGCAGYRRGDDAVWVCYRRRREFPEGFGSGTRLVTIPDFASRTRLLQLLHAVGHRGLFDAEFKLDPRDGTFRLLDINARSWWQNALPTRSGINMIALAYEDAANPDHVRPLPPQSYAVGVEWIHGYNDYMAARDAGMGLGAWLRSLPPRGELAFFAADDPLPGTLQLSGIAWRMFRGFAGGKVKDERGYQIGPAMAPSADALVASLPVEPLLASLPAEVALDPLPLAASPPHEPPHAAKDAGAQTALR